MFHNIFNSIIFQRRQKALLWSKGVKTHICIVPAILTLSPTKNPLLLEFSLSNFSRMPINFGKISDRNLDKISF